MTSQFQDFINHKEKKSVKCVFCDIWVQNFVWNFKGHFRNFTQNFERKKRKIYILRSATKLTTYDRLKLWHLKSYWDGPLYVSLKGMFAIKHMTPTTVVDRMTRITKYHYNKTFYVCRNGFVAINFAQAKRKQTSVFQEQTLRDTESIPALPT